MNVNGKDGRGCTAIHLAAEFGHVDILPHLQSVGLDINALTEGNSHAMHYAAKGGKIPAVEYLMRLGIDPRVLNGCCQHPLGFHWE